MMDDKKLILITEQLASLLIKRNKKLAVAESCTGGWVAKVLTDLAGSSAWFERGFITYSNEAKHEMLGVAESTLETYGAVSEETIKEMALGVLKNSHADFSLSISGIAGPHGETKDKPIGYVWFCWAINENNKLNIIMSKNKVFDGDRSSVRLQAVEYALTELVSYLEKTYG